ncbi:hypothetical protein AX14_001364 [Amanita brunnescens Koide BX004]|nr:hypothetical protein AX14_001364 [Amanita brunnescens Koide BX004]
MAAPDPRSISITIVRAVNLPFPVISHRRAHVEIDAGGMHHQTKTVETTKEKITRWDIKFDFPLLDNSSKIIIVVLRDSKFKGFLGKVSIELERLLELQDSQPNEDVVLSLVEKKGKPNKASLYLRVTQDSLSAVASDIVEQADTSGKKLSGLHVPDVSVTLSEGKSLVTSLGACLNRIKPLIKIGDEISKIHPYVGFAWTVLSVGMKVVQAQQARDGKILDLIKAMEKAYSFSTSAKELEDYPPLQDVIVGMLKKTIVCGYFIQDYTQPSFGARAIMNLITNVDERIGAFCTEFEELRKDFDSIASLKTALDVNRMASVVSQIASAFNLTQLGPELMDESKRTSCLENTRQNIVEDIKDWLADVSDDQKKVLWVYGMAGTGKSTLSTTIAEITRKLERLGAFFFFDRNITQRDSATLFRTLAYELAKFDTCLGAAISQVVEKDHNIGRKTPDHQFEELLHNALKSIQWFRGPIVIIIDALDECPDRKDLIKVLSNCFSKLPSFLRILIFSREESDIRNSLGSPLHVLSYHLDKGSTTNKDDISAFFRHRLEEICKNNPYLNELRDNSGAHWPGDDNIRALSDAADGLFVWASTACLYIEEYAAFGPNQCLHELINMQPERNFSGPFEQLDKLYMTGLRQAGSWDHSRFGPPCRRILGVILCARVPLSHCIIDALLELPASPFISRLRCFLQVEKETDEIRILHTSFYDYLSSKRYEAEDWYIDLEFYNKECALACIKLLDKGLRENICDMTLPYHNKSKPLPSAISYASKFWIEHVCLISNVADDILNQIYNFLEKHLLHWMEVMAILKYHDSTIRSLHDLIDWLQKLSRNFEDLHQLVYDGHRFARYFASTIMEHPLLLYTTALPFTPTNTSIFKKFYHNHLPKVVCGAEKTWPALLMKLEGHKGAVTSVACSPDGSKIVSGSWDGTIRIWDASTGIEMLPPLRGHDGPINSVAFSPYGSKIVSGSGGKTIRVWDASTGIEMLPPLRGHDQGLINSVAFSPDGSKIVSGSHDKTIRVWDASTGAAMLPPLQGHDSPISSVTFSPDGLTIVSGSWDHTIRVWDISTGTETLPSLRGHDNWISSVAFSPDGSKIVSGSFDKTIRVWDASSGIEMLPALQGHDEIHSVAFSHDGSKIISGSQDRTIRVWDANTGAEIPPALRGHHGPIYFVAFSPDGSKIISASANSTIGVWDASIKVMMFTLIPGHDGQIHSVAFSPDGSQVVSGVEARERVTISVGVFGDVSWTGNRLSTTVTRTFLFGNLTSTSSGFVY